MTDDVKAANEALVESMVRQLRGCISVGDEMTLDHACLIDDAEAWIAGEPARTAAAVAAAREEQRAVDRDLVEQSAEFCDCIEALEDAGVDATPMADRIAGMADELHDECEVSQSLREQLIAAEGASRYLTERLDAAGDLLAQLEKAEAERDRLAGDVLAALAGAGVATPLEGYTAAPFLLKGDIGRLAAERDALRAQVTLTDGPCVECGEPTQWAAGNPGLWVVMLPTEAEPGVVKHHHVKCVLGWQAQVEAARAWAAEHACGVEPCLRGRECRDAREVLAAMDGAKPK